MASYTELLLNQDPNTLLKDLIENLEEKPKMKDFLATVAREMFNASMPTIFIKKDELCKALKIGLAAKFTSGKSLITVQDMLDSADEAFELKIKKILITAIEGMGTHVPKMQSTCIPDPALSFSTGINQLKTGITSTSFQDVRQLTGSQNGKYISGYGFLSCSYKHNNQEPKTVFEMLIDKDEQLISFLSRFYETNEINEMVLLAKAKHEETPSPIISQFHKQNFVNFNGEKITVSCLQSARTSIALHSSIKKMFEDNGAINTVRYVAGGANSQNVSSLNQDLGGGIRHLKAWIPSNDAKRDAFYYAYKLKATKLNKTQRDLIRKLLWLDSKITDKQFSNINERIGIENIFKQVAEVHFDQISFLADEISLLKKDDELAKLNDVLSSEIKNYLLADSKTDKTEASEEIAFSLVAAISSEMKRNKLDHNLGPAALDVITAVFEKGEVKSKCTL